MSKLLLQALKDLGRKRPAIANVRAAYWNAYPELRAEAAADARLLEALRDLERQELIQLPAQASWEQFGNPRMPLFITLLTRGPRPVGPDWTAIAWVPEMGFWTDLKSGQLPAARTINEFLLRHRGGLEIVPIKERSLQILGDEKALDRMRSGDSLFSGRLPLRLLGAEVVSLPLAFEPSGVRGLPILVVENHSSYYSFCRWNATTKAFSAVAYGHGNAFLSAARFLDELHDKTCASEVLYLGDIDPKGCQIPLEFNHLEGARAKVRPAMRHYEWLLSHGVRTPTAQFNGSPVAGLWLGQQLGNQVAQLWKSGLRVPQEGLGYEALLSWGAGDLGAVFDKTRA